MGLLVVFRVDGSREIGSGHVARCLTLAGQLSRMGAVCRFVCRQFPDALGRRIADAGFSVEWLAHSRPVPAENWLGETTANDAQQTLQVLEAGVPDWLVVDHYGVDREWQAIVRKRLPETRLMVIDELLNRAHDCDLLLDQTPLRGHEEYRDLVSANCQFAIGPEYALMKPEFARNRSKMVVPPRQVGHPAKILVALGGGKTSEFLREAAAALCDLETRHDLVVTLVGVEEALLKDFPAACRSLDYTENMAGEIAACDLMICGAGGTTWERCCLGVPGVVLQIADNQSFNISAIGELGLGIHVPNAREAISNALDKLMNDQALYAQIAGNCRDVCDGEGARRVADLVVQPLLGFADCTIEDARFVHDARYAGDAARYYRNPQIPRFEDHLNWFERALASERYHLYRVSLANEDIAHIRLDPDPDNTHQCEIGIALAEHARGKNLAVPVLQAATQKAAEMGLTRIDAEIHAENKASQRVFERAGFSQISAGGEDNCWLKYHFVA